jgi:hypothetical protein
MGRFTKNSAKKNSTKITIVNNETLQAAESPSGQGADDRKHVAVHEVARSSSSDHLNFEEKRKLIASSLSLSEVLAAECHRQPRYLLNASLDAQDQDEDRHEFEEVPDVGRRWEKLGGIGLIGMGSKNSSPLPSHPRPYLLARPSTPSPLTTARPDASMPARPASVCAISFTGFDSGRDDDDDDDREEPRRQLSVDIGSLRAEESASSPHVFVNPVTSLSLSDLLAAASPGTIVSPRAARFRLLYYS